MVGVAWCHVEPANVISTATFGDHANPGGLVAVPFNRKRRLQKRPSAEHDAEIQNDRVVFRDRHVVDLRHAA